MNTEIKDQNKIIPFARPNHGTIDYSTEPFDNWRIKEEKQSKTNQPNKVKRKILNYRTNNCSR